MYLRWLRRESSNNTLICVHKANLVAPLLALRLLLGSQLSLEGIHDGSNPLNRTNILEPTNQVGEVISFDCRNRLTVTVKGTPDRNICN